MFFFPLDYSKPLLFTCFADSKLLNVSPFSLKGGRWLYCCNRPPHSMMGMAIFPSGRIALSFDDWGCDISNLNLQEPANAIKQFRWSQSQSSGLRHLIHHLIISRNKHSQGKILIMQTCSYGKNLHIPLHITYLFLSLSLLLLFLYHFLKNQGSVLIPLLLFLHFPLKLWNLVLRFPLPYSNWSVVSPTPGGGDTWVRAKAGVLNPSENPAPTELLFIYLSPNLYVPPSIVYFVT